MSEHVLAIDPGERVGWAVGDCGPGPEDLDVCKRGVTPLKDFAIKLYESAPNYDTIVYESWRLYPEMGKKLVGNDMQPSQLVGMIRLIGWLNPSVKLVTQGASIKNTALKVMSPEMLLSLEDSSEQHDQDAVMHLVFYHWYKNVAKQA